MFRWPRTRTRRSSICLALQGGGSHGAFTWGVLDRLLETGNFSIKAISGASAGAMNAAMLAIGCSRDGDDGARAMLRTFWEAVGVHLPWPAAASDNGDLPSLAGLTSMTHFFSPYEFNPLDLNPLRELCKRLLDTNALAQASAPRLLIAATHVASGHLRLFGNAEIDVNTLLASACLPQLQQAIHIDGEAYWDGGYCANPPILSLLTRFGPTDVLSIALHPARRERAPIHANEIDARINELTFTNGFHAELRAIAETREFLAKRRWPILGAYERCLLNSHFHRIDGDPILGHLSNRSRLNNATEFIRMLHNYGRQRADEWLASHAHDVGRRSSIDLTTVTGVPRRNGRVHDRSKANTV